MNYIGELSADKEIIDGDRMIVIYGGGNGWLWRKNISKFNDI